MDRSLMDAARAGNVEGLYASIGSNPRILDSVDEYTFANTLLHAAASTGHTQFAMEIMILKPSFGRKLNPEGLSPLHLAVRNGHFETAKGLVKFDSELIRVKGKEGYTPLHYVAAARADINGDLMVEFLCACPASVKDLTNLDQTAVHIAVKNKNLHDFEVLFEWLRKIRDTEVLDWPDDKGNTVLHIAVSEKQTKIVELLVKKPIGILNEKNLQGFTALDIAERLDDHDEASRDIKKILHRVKAIRGSALADNESLGKFLTSEARAGESMLRFILNCRRNLSVEISNMILVVAVLIATAAFQAVLSPPGGFSLGVDNNNNQTTTTTTTGGNNTTTTTNPNPVPGYIGKFGKRSFIVFYWVNTIAFNASSALITLILPLRSFSNFLVHLSLFFLVASYGFSLFIISEMGLVKGYLMAVSYVFSYIAYFLFSLYVWFSELYMMSEFKTFLDMILDMIVHYTIVLPLVPWRCLLMLRCCRESPRMYVKDLWKHVKAWMKFSSKARVRMIYRISK